MEENITIVFHGFLNLSMKEKLQLVKEMNNYFDSTNREPIREVNETKFKNIDLTLRANKCKCCER